jgi:DNA-binding MarR family transcriptional regulator
MNAELFDLIVALKRKCQCHEEQIRSQLGLSPAEFNALAALDSDGEMTGCEFAEKVALSPSRGSRVLNRLVTDGYVRTQVHPADRRTIRVGTTRKGRLAQRRIRQHMMACEERLRRSLSHAEIGRAVEALNRLVATL